MTTTLWKELDDRFAERTAGGRGWTDSYEITEYRGDWNGNGTGLDEFLQGLPYYYGTGGPTNLKQVLKKPDAYFSVENFTNEGFTYSIISFKYEEQRPRQSSVLTNYRIARL